MTAILEKLTLYWAYPFVRYALIVGVLIALCSSLLGVTLVLKRFSFIGDGLSHIAEIVTCMEYRCTNCTMLREMAKAAIKMVTESSDAYVRRDTGLAQQVIAEDDIVDEYFDRIKQELIPQIAQNPANGERAIDLLMIAKYFERIGDHAVNIAEWVIFSVTGIHKSSELQ